MSRFVLPCAVLAALCACGEEKAKPAPAASNAVAAAPAKAPAAAPAASSVDREKVMAAYDKGLDYLLSKQHEGKWSVQGHPHAGFSALAIAPVIERPGGMREKDKAIVAQVLPWLASQLGPDGGIKAEFSSNYETSVVIMALAASKDPKYKADIDRAAAYIKKLQFVDEKDPSYGGIGYGDDGPVSDLSNTEYALAALKAAGVPETDPLYQKALVFLERAQNRKENEKPGDPTFTDKTTGKKVVRGNDGGAAYAPGNAEHTGYETAPDGTLVIPSYGSMTYALLRCYHLAGLDASDGRMKAAVDWISKHWTLDANPGMPEAHKASGLYYYYATIGKTLPEVGLDAVKSPAGSIDWRAALAGKLLAEQKPDGTWANTVERWMEADPVLATSYALTALGSCVR
jgi:squalene-hopene/tetraprenyl-beta-curcumene cyclase